MKKILFFILILIFVLSEPKFVLADKNSEIYILISSLKNEQCKLYTIEQYENWKKVAELMAQSLLNEFNKSIEQEMEDLGLFSPDTINFYIKTRSDQNKVRANQSYIDLLNKFSVADTYNKCLEDIKLDCSLYGNAYPDSDNKTCYCNIDYEWNFDKTQCVKKVTKEVETTNIIQNNNTTKKEITCKNGYALSLDKKECIKIPEHAHTVESLTDVWLCDDGYKEVNNSCIIVDNIETQVSSSTDENIETKENLINEQLTDEQSNEKVNEPHNLKDRIIKPIKLFFNRLFTKLANWFSK